MKQIIMLRQTVRFVSIAFCALLAGCATYVAPGHAADFKAIGADRAAQTDATIAVAVAKKPLATFPCGIAAVRIQAAGYASKGTQTYGTGAFCVVTTRDVEADTDWKKLAELPMVTGVSPLNRLLLPSQFNTDLELRQTAAAVHADMLLVYTIDTNFQVNDHLAPLTVVTLGLSPNMTAQVVTTASAVLMDTRNGYIYGNAESTERGIQLTNGWMTDQAVDDARRATETKAFAKLATALQQTWPGVLKTYAPPTSRPAQTASAR